MKIIKRARTITFKSMILAMIKIELYKNLMVLGHILKDVAYHKNKLDRKIDKLINILGADHAGYIKRISSSVEALSSSKIN